MAPTKCSTVFKFLRFAAAGLSAVCCLAAFVGCLLRIAPASWDISSEPIQLSLYSVSYPSDPSEHFHLWTTIGHGMAKLRLDTWEFKLTSFPADLGVRGVFFYRAYESERWREHILAIYLWIPALVFAIYPFIVFVRSPLRRRRRLRRGLCLACGYHVTSGGQTTCPECGTQRVPACARRPADRTTH